MRRKNLNLIGIFNYQILASTNVLIDNIACEMNGIGARSNNISCIWFSGALRCRICGRFEEKGMGL
jgi:hypothetical protein